MNVAALDQLYFARGSFKAETPLRKILRSGITARTKAQLLQDERFLETVLFKDIPREHRTRQVNGAGYAMRDFRVRSVLTDLLPADKHCAKRMANLDLYELVVTPNGKPGYMKLLPDCGGKFLGFNYCRDCGSVGYQSLKL